MSVICQNFVQNAWKKDLCSNCFKSVGDHEMSESISNDQMKNSNGRYVSQASSGSPSMSNSAPHTTWKSLISERNSKNSQPFKLETGFQGRLLTINKASHAGEKNGVNNGSLKNGHASDSELSSQQSKRTVNGRITKTDFSQIKKNSQPINGYSMQNGNRHLEVKVEHNGTKIKDVNNERGTTFQKIHDANKETSKQGFVTASKELKLVKSKSEDTLYTPIHSILKKTVSTPVKEKQSRRGSNVGFAEEEPLVIGYGGRDFSAEELEWDMNSSDGENDNGMDSLDETEDDKAFSTMTKRNTEFNSDNANLIQKNASNPEKKETRRSERNTEQKEIDKTPSHVSVTSEECNGNMKNGISNLIKSTKSAVQVVTDDSDTETMIVKNKDGSTNEDKSALHNGSKLAELEIKDSKLERQLPRKDKNDSINVSIKGDKTTHVVASGEVTIIETAKVGESRVEVKNNSVNEAVPPSRAISTTANFDGSHCERSENQVMFSDGEERIKETSNPVPDENTEWQNDDGLAGQILQAINTSLANRHKINDNQEIESNQAADPSSESTNENKNQECLSTDECNGANSVSDESTEKNTSSDEEIVQNGINVEPRKSFLHGLTSNKSNKPSAIYGPASDLFVSRSNSSSSSSSDELSKSEISHSINVIVNGNKAHKPGGNDTEDITESENEDLRSQHSYLNEQDSNCSVKFKAKPKIPIKPLKKPIQPPMKQTVNEYSETKPVEANRRISDSNILNDSYYSEANSTSYSESPNNISLIGHYAESNIYHEVDNVELKVQDEQGERIDPRESKLAALAMELEQVRHSNNTKRQAPAPPKIPDPPLEDPPNSIGRVSPSISDNSHGFPSYRGEVMGFSSASSTASTSSQDTETGYASWNLHGDLDDHRKHSKSKSSFLLTQYSKCKMLAMGYTDDSSRSRKKFSIKKLLKIKKENEGSAAFDPNGPNPKAWKYSDHFEKPRPKLEIIHPMDLENKSVTINPGFDSLHSGSMSSFSASADDLSLRNSVSSDYGSFYSDTISPIQDLKTEVNYDSIPQQLLTSEQQEDGDERQVTGNSNSPTPSRSSCISQASTLTSGSSKNGGASPHRPPKPPPPPRAHSLLPGNKALNPDGTFKFPVVNCNSVNCMDVPVSPTKPQAPKRQSKSSIQRFDCGIYDNTGLVSTPEEVETPNENNSSLNNKVSVDGNTYGTILDIRPTNAECHNSGLLGSTTISELPIDDKKEDTESQSVLVSKSEIHSINVTVTNVTEPAKKFANTVVSRNKHSPLTKAPARPPPIYMKSQINNIVKNPNPWKTLEDSYLVLTASNRELLVKLVNQALKKRKNFLIKLQKIKFQWAEFEIDVEQPSSVFAFGEKIAYHATMPKYPEYSVTLVVTVQQQHCRLHENNDIKYPVFGQFVDYIPKELLENSSDAELESMQATILVLDRSNISTIECFTESLPMSLTEENEKELCFIILQLIHSLKSLQAQGIESIESSFQNLILAKTKKDKYNTLVFLYDNCYDENDYMSDSCKISLCQYTLMLLFQMLGIQSIEEFILVSDSKFSSEVAKKIFKTAISLLSEEKAVSLSQTKTLFECFLWEITRVLKCLEDSEDVDNVLHRWLDIKRANYIKNIYDDENVCDINIQSEYYSQFLLRTSIRNVREILSLL